MSLGTTLNRDNSSTRDKTLLYKYSSFANSLVFSTNLKALFHQLIQKNQFLKKSITLPPDFLKPNAISDICKKKEISKRTKPYIGGKETIATHLSNFIPALFSHIILKCELR